ncbi:TPA: uracil-DNA glycosylase [Candidatus Taylorbacteria bacterium]|nr:uracil-DNA glycosylase [Candidatus Taylorbacteria bacterium]
MKRDNEKNRSRALRLVEEEVTNLKKSVLYLERIKNGVLPVIGEGSIFADIMFIGEAPGRKEAETGKPFCGSSGKILDSLLESIEVDRQHVYVTSIVKDRPPKNRDPFPAEIDIYAPFLDRQIEIIQPKVIATLGRFSMIYIMQKFGLSGDLKTISLTHGKWFEARTGYGKVTIIPLYHPAAAIYNQKLKDTLKKDFQIIKKYAKKKPK